MPGSNKQAKKLQQKANVEAGLGDKDGRLVRVKVIIGLELGFG
jgi:hypothetical protein